MHHGKWILASVAIVMLALSLAAAGERFDVSEGDDPFATSTAAPQTVPPEMPLGGRPGEANPFDVGGDTKRIPRTGTDPSRRPMPARQAEHAEPAGSTPRVMPAVGPVAAESDLVLDVLPTPGEADGLLPESLPLPPKAIPLGGAGESPSEESPFGETPETPEAPFDETPFAEPAGTDAAEAQSPARTTARTAADAAAVQPMPMDDNVSNAALPSTALPDAGAADAEIAAGTPAIVPGPTGQQGFRVDSSFTPAPAGTAGASAVTLEWVRRTEVSVGQPCQCDLLVKNTGEVAVHDVQVQAYFPPTVRFLRETKPAPTARSTDLIWSLGTIPAGEARTIELHLIPSQRGELAASAFVRCTSGSALRLEVAEPMLHVELKGPSEVQIGDPASQIITISNPGTGTAQHVEIRASVPAGLEHAAGSQLALKIGALSPGESRMVRLALAAVSGGEHTVRVVAEARRDVESEPYLRKSIEASVRVIAPSVQVKVDGPTLRYKNREAIYQVRVANDGTAVCNNVRVVHNLPDGFRFIGADQGGQHDPVGRTVSWFVGRIEPNQAVELNVTLLASKLGPQVHRVAAITEQGAGAEVELTTVIDGVPALVLKVADQSDPVEVGAETAYEITVRNEGTKSAQNVAVTCDVPPGVELVGTDGPTDAAGQSGAVTFAPVASLPPGEAVQYRLTIRGRQDGFQRLKAHVLSESLPEPLSAEVLTRFYGQP